MRTPFILAAIAAAGLVGPAGATGPRQPHLDSRTIPILHVQGLAFRDLDRNGRLEAYEDWRLPPARRAADLLARMTMDEKIGQMMHGSLREAGDDYNVRLARGEILGKHVTAMITRLATTPAKLAVANNGLQAMAEEGRLGIPLTLSSDPRNQLGGVMGASVAAGGFTPFPDPLGFAAIGDAAATRRAADIVRQEYRAVGIREALSPQADIATEPRWPRIDGTFGSNPALAARMIGAYVTGIQAGSAGIGPTSVAAVVKHWVGYGAVDNQGFDSHNYYGRFTGVTNAALPQHILPFQAAFAAHVAGVMPMYSLAHRLRDAAGQPVETGAGFSRYLLTDLLRRRYGYDGLILSDWAITSDCNDACRNGAKPGVAPSWADADPAWGVEDIPEAARFAKGVDAGVEQFGGTTHVDMLAAAVRSGAISRAQIDAAVRKVLTQTFALGLFEDPYVDPHEAAALVGNARFQAEAHRLQARSIVLLETRRGLYPLNPKTQRRLFLRGIDAAPFAALGFTIVDRLDWADAAIVRLSTPHQLLHPNFPAGRVQHEGALDFRDGDPEFEAVKRIGAAVPTIAIVHLDRAAVLTALRPHVAVLAGDFGATDDAVADALTDRIRAEGRLPLELPASMAAVAAQRPEVPDDSRTPLYPFGYRAGVQAPSRIITPTR
ncbi:glycoside hydrolase family 3 protein [Sphingomonas sp. ASY06-1R]|uniref:glycoside hydrolase family 3 protein n=1 Tax=Sphingomonas sp. ASY06-1R TaxID=3445771 RepID=UPI003FA2052E